MNISIVIPVYNGEKTLRKLYSKIKNTLNADLTYELIFVYDSGKDNSWKIIAELAKNDPDHVRGFHFNKNYGQHRATLFGLKKASGDYIITMDEDNQHDPKYIPEMIKKLEEEKLDFVYGKFRKTKQNFLRVFLSLILRKILLIMVPNLPQEYSAYRVIRKELAAKLLESNSHFSFIDVGLGKLSSKNSSILIDHHKRLKGSSSYTINILFKQSLDVLFEYSSMFRKIYDIFLIFLVLSITITFYQTITHPAQLLLVLVILLLILSVLLLIRMNSFKRINSKFDPLVIDQINQGK